MSSVRQPTHPAPDVPTVRQPTNVADVFVKTVARIATLALAIVWVVIWLNLSFTTVQLENLSAGVILGVYTVVPVVGYLAYRAIRLLR